MTAILNKEKILDIARIYAEEGKYDKAISEYEKIILADPKDPRVKLRLAELYTKRKQITEAIRIYREVACFYSDEGFYLKAVTVLKNILRLNPTLVDVNQMLAELYEKMGLLQDAVRQYNILATTLEQKGDEEKALEIRKKIVESDTTSETARIKLAEIYQRQGKIEEALEQYIALISMYKATGKKNAKLADMYEKVLAHRQDNEMLKDLCRIYDSLGEKRKVLKWLEQAKEIVLGDAELLAMQAQIYKSLNQIETARAKFLALAELEKETGRTTEALEAYAEILLMMPGEEDKIFRRLENFGESAVEKLQTIVKKRREELEEIEREKAEELERQKEEQQKEEAKQLKAEKGAQSAKELEKPPPVSEKEAEVAFNLGSAYWQMKLIDEAKTEFEKARRIFLELERAGGDFKKRLRDIEKILGERAGKEVPRREKAELPLKKKKITFV